MTERPDDVIELGPATLRRYREDDLDALMQAVSESEDHLRPWLPWVAGHSRESEAEFLAQAAQDWDARHGLQLRDHRRTARWPAASR